MNEPENEGHAAENDPEKPVDERPDQVSFEYIKSNLFRVIHADGVWGGNTPRNQILMAFYSERPPIPRRATYQVSPAGKLGNELKDKRVTRDAIVREVEACILMDVPLARVLISWLQEKIEASEKCQPEEKGDRASS